MDQLLLSIPDVWLPLPGPQTEAYYSLADELFYGGAAGGGKTDLVLGLASTSHRRSCIYRMEYPQLDAIVERSQEVFGARYGNKFNGQKYQWKLEHGARLLDLRAMQNINVLKKHQGRPHDLKAFDEITHFHRMQFVFTKAWCRTVIPHQRIRVVATGNPPTDAEGRWVVDYWAPWLKEDYPNPAKNGDLRWFISAEGRDFEVECKGVFKYKGSQYESKSRTFIGSNLNDNLYLEGTDYRATLDSLPEPLRSQLLFGNFKAGIQEDPWQIIPVHWVRLAQKRWKERRKPSGPIEKLGLDVARGGTDRTVVTPRWGNYFGEGSAWPGAATPTGKVIAELLLIKYPDKPDIGVDAVGVGSSPVDFLRLAGFNVDSLNGAEGSSATDRSKKLGFINKRAEWWWKLREALDPELGDDLAIPDDPELLSDLCAPRWSLTLRGVKVEDKEEIKKRLGRSPDKGESLLYSTALPGGTGLGLLNYLKGEYEEKEKNSSSSPEKFFSHPDSDPHNFFR